MTRLRLIGLTPVADQLSEEDRNDLKECIGKEVRLEGNAHQTTGGLLYTLCDGVATHEMFLKLAVIT